MPKVEPTGEININVILQVHTAMAERENIPPDLIRRCLQWVADREDVFERGISLILDAVISSERELFGQPKRVSWLSDDVLEEENYLETKQPDYRLNADGELLAPHVITFEFVQKVIKALDGSEKVAPNAVWRCFRWAMNRNHDYRDKLTDLRRATTSIQLEFTGHRKPDDHPDSGDMSPTIVA